MTLILALITLLFVYIYNFFINYHIIIVFISAIPLMSNPFINNALSYSAWAVLIIYWGLSYSVFIMIYYNVYLIYVFHWLNYVLCKVTSTTILYILIT